LTVSRGNGGSWICYAFAVANRFLAYWRHAMRRVISLYLPHWPTDRLRRASKDAPPRDKPLVTAMMLGQRRVIASVDQAAARLDLSCGMTVTHAQSLIPDLEVVEATPEEDDAALLRLGLWCIRYSPLVTPNPPDGVFIDVAGSAHLFQGEAALIGDLCKRLIPVRESRRLNHIQARLHGRPRLVRRQQIGRATRQICARSFRRMEHKQKRPRANTRGRIN
jgi:impB/mucB/samB family